MLSANKQRCKRLEHLAPLIFLSDEFEITVVSDDSDVELRFRVSASMPVRILQFEIQFFCILLAITFVICQGWCI